MRVQCVHIVHKIEKQQLFHGIELCGAQPIAYILTRDIFRICFGTKLVKTN